jgi:phosphoribulokinase
MPRPIILGVVGDSAAGKTTITRGLVRALGKENVNHVCTDDYHRYDRKQRAERGITPLHPDCNYVDVMTQDLVHLGNGRAILKPVYRHSDGTFGPPEYIPPTQFAVVEGLLGYHTADLRATYDVRVFLAPPEELRRKWKVARDCSRRGYTTDQVLAELDRREPDSETFIRPQQHHADIVVSFLLNGTVDDEQLDAELILRPSLEHPDLSPFTDDEGGIQLEERGADCLVRIPGRIPRSHALEVEEAIWERMHFASHLRSERLGEFTQGTVLHRSESLALVQLLVLYHLLTAKASIALGSERARAAAPA